MQNEIVCIIFFPFGSDLFIYCFEFRKMLGLLYLSIDIWLNHGLVN
jgi:hypothetical protein